MAFALSQSASEGGQEPHAVPKFVPEDRWRILLLANLRPFSFLSISSGSPFFPLPHNPPPLPSHLRWSAHQSLPLQKKLVRCCHFSLKSLISIKMEYTRPKSSHLSTPMDNPVETIRADHTPPSSAHNLKPSPPFLPAQGLSANTNTPGSFPASAPASPRPTVDSLRGSLTPLNATPQQISWRADVAFTKKKTPPSLTATPRPRSYSSSDIESAEILLMLYYGRPGPAWDPEETESEEELAAK